MSTVAIGIVHFPYQEFQILVIHTQKKFLGKILMIDEGTPIGIDYGILCFSILY